MLTIGHNHFAFLQVRVLKEAMMLVGKAYFIRFVTTLIAHFADGGHRKESFYFLIDKA
jgi:hypothetical protein